MSSVEQRRAAARAFVRRTARRLPPRARDVLRTTASRVDRRRTSVAVADDAAQWRRRYLLEQFLDGADVTALRARIEADPGALPPMPAAIRSERGIADGDLLARGNALIDAVDNLAAAELFEHEVQLPGRLTDHVLLRWALALHRCSRYEQALAVLAICDDRDAADVAAADTAWVLHDRDRLGTHARALAARRPDHPRAKALAARARATEPTLPTTGTAFVHVAAYVGKGGNYGDRVLPVAVRQAVSSVRTPPSRFVSVQAHQLFDDARRELADRSAGVIVGGGGLFLPDTSPNGNSGWQWNVPAEQLRRLDVPLGIVAVGFNLFRGQSFAGDLFAENLTRLIDRADLVGLRNHGSIRAVRSMLPAHLAAKVEYLPCPTTVLAHLEPEPGEPVTRRRSVLINAAYDRSDHRFGSRYGNFLAQLAGYVKELHRCDVTVEIASHMAPDEKLAVDLRADHGLDLPLHRLDAVPLEQARRIYREAGLVVGMRGHATMIPFGLRTPVLSLVSHPKMRYFLDDIAHPEWGFEVGDRFGPALLERTHDVLAEPDSYVADIRAAQVVLLDAVQAPLRRFLSA